VKPLAGHIGIEIQRPRTSEWANKDRSTDNLVGRCLMRGANYRSTSRSRHF